MLEEFKQQYYEKAIMKKGWDDDIESLFQRVLEDEFNDNPELMSAFIEEIIEEYNPSVPQPNTNELQEQIDTLQMMINQLSIK
ncbi:hypothetical protein GH870_32445 [Bacillus thuringiensis]|nr:hypothetical protein [Bacillus thuringiensis]MRC26276.1 hypothetical protein [Bacillus thuringiensis]MRD22509.1 hypothetical protein [Bacillus thuringiensis]MRD45523.1 hypothetical protein [Bacillus thuringiensis]